MAVENATNCTFEVKGKMLIITADLSEPHHEADKSHVYASSNGNRKVATPDGEFTFSFNAFKYKPKNEWWTQSRRRR